MYYVQSGGTDRLSDIPCGAASGASAQILYSALRQYKLRAESPALTEAESLYIYHADVRERLNQTQHKYFLHFRLLLPSFCKTT